MKRPWTDERGTLYEIPILLMLLGVILAIALPRALKQPSLARGALAFLGTALAVAAVAAAALGLLILFFGALDRLEAFRRRKRLAGALRGLDDSDPRVRLDSARALGENPAGAKDAAPALKAALGDSAAAVRFAAAAALARVDSSADAERLLADAIGPAALPSVLSEVLRDPDPELRAASARLARALGPRASPLVPDLIRALGAPEEFAASEAIQALGAVGAASAPAVPALIAALRGPSYLLRRWAIDALGRIGPAASAAVPALEALKPVDAPEAPSSVFERRIIAEALAAIRR
jgi:HEAT repeat protein